MLTGGFGLSGVLCGASCYSVASTGVVMLENVTLMVLLMFLGVGVTVAILIGFIYYMEFME